MRKIALFLGYLISTTWLLAGECSARTAENSPPTPLSDVGNRPASLGEAQGELNQGSEKADHSSSVVKIRVDGTRRYQTISGFGATLTVFENDGVYKRHDHNQPERVFGSEADRRSIAQLLYTQLGLSRARVVLGGFEPNNDNDDPFRLNAGGFDWRIVDAETHFIALARPAGLLTWWASAGLESDADSWRRKSGSHCVLDPAKIDEEVEWLLAGALRFRDRKAELKYLAVMNEPDLCPSVHGTGKKIEVADLVTIVKKLGKRLRDNGLRTKIVVSDGWLPQNALLYMQEALADPEARQFVGALAFHSYDSFDDPGLMLRTSARSAPPNLSVEVRKKIRELATRNRLPVWMTEVCYCSPRAFSDFDLIRARLNHVYDELTITNVSAFDAMNLFFIDRPRVRDELVHVYFRPDGKLDGYEISTYGYLLSHFSRFISIGSVRLGAESGDASLRVTAFERPDGSPVIIALNNHSSAVRANVSLNGMAKSTRALTILSSREGAVLQRMPDLVVTRAADLGRGKNSKTYEDKSDQQVITLKVADTVVLPALSVTTFYVPGRRDAFIGTGLLPNQPDHEDVTERVSVKGWDSKKKEAIH